MEPATAVLLVHGIGSQRAGETAAKLTDGLQRAYPGATADLHDGCGTIAIGARTLRVYEVWWADLLDGDDVRGSFSVWSLHVLAWLPWLNWRAGSIPRRRVTALLWTAVLAPLVLLVQLAYLVSAVFDPVRRMLDERVADVLNYVDSADRELSDDSPLADVAERMEATVAARLGEAIDDGADDVVVVAHSLGSVIAYRSLMRGLADGRDERWRRISTFMTIGSPLRTFSLVWPRLVTPVQDAPVPAVRWHNFHDLFDPVAGGTRHVRPFAEPACDHIVFGRAGFALAHTSYEKHPTFLAVLGQTLLGAPPEIRVSASERVRLLVQSVLECLAVVAGSALILAIGTVVAVFIGAVLAVVFAMLTVLGTIIENYAAWEQSGFTFWGSVRTVFAVLMVVAFLIGPLVVGRTIARRRHYVHIHNKAPVEVSRVGEDVPEPPGWVAVVGAVLGAALAVAWVVALWGAEGMPAAWDEGVSVIGRAALVLAYAFFGAFGALFGTWILFGLHWCVQTWHQWRTATHTRG